MSGLLMAGLAQHVRSSDISMSSGFSAFASLIEVAADLSKQLQNVAGKQLLLLE